MHCRRLRDHAGRRDAALAREEREAAAGRCRPGPHRDAAALGKRRRRTTRRSASTTRPASRWTRPNIWSTSRGDADRQRHERAGGNHLRRAGSDSFIPVHKYLLVEQGVHIGEFHYLEDLARDKAYEFRYVAAVNKSPDRGGLHAAAAGDEIDMFLAGSIRAPGNRKWNVHPCSPATRFVPASVMATIIRVHAREILDSRGKPTVEAEVRLDSGVVGSRQRAERREHGSGRGVRAARWRPGAV